MFSDWKRENVNFHRRIPQAIVWVHTDNLTYDNGSKVVLEFEKHHLSRLRNRLYSPDINLGDFWLFGMLEGIMKDPEFHSTDEIEKASAST
jgi:hypothetical protein